MRLKTILMLLTVCSRRRKPRFRVRCSVANLTNSALSMWVIAPTIHLCSTRLSVLGANPSKSRECKARRTSIRSLAKSPATARVSKDMESAR